MLFILASIVVSITAWTLTESASAWRRRVGGSREISRTRGQPPQAGREAAARQGRTCCPAAHRLGRHVQSQQLSAVGPSVGRSAGRSIGRIAQSGGRSVSREVGRYRGTTCVWIWAKLGP